jgi:hypothetical protein
MSQTDVIVYYYYYYYYYYLIKHYPFGIRKLKRSAPSVKQRWILKYYIDGLETSVAYGGHFLACSQNYENRLLASSRLFVLIEKLGSHWNDFHEILHLSIFRQPVEKIQVSLQSDKNKEDFKWRPVYVHLWYLAQFFLECEMFWRWET